MNHKTPLTGPAVLHLMQAEGDYHTNYRSETKSQPRDCDLELCISFGLGRRLAKESVKCGFGLSLFKISN